MCAISCCSPTLPPSSLQTHCSPLSAQLLWIPQQPPLASNSLMYHLLNLFSHPHLEEKICGWIAEQEAKWWKKKKKKRKTSATSSCFHSVDLLLPGQLSLCQDVVDRMEKVLPVEEATLVCRWNGSLGRLLVVERPWRGINIAAACLLKDKSKHINPSSTFETDICHLVSRLTEWWEDHHDGRWHSNNAFIRTQENMF